MKLNKLLLNKDKSTKIVEHFLEETTVKNVTLFYSVAKRYQLYNAAKKTLAYIERCF